MDVGREIVAGHFDGVVRHDAAHGDDGNLRGAATDVDHHVAFGRIDIEADADGRGHGFEDEVDVTSAGMLGRVAHGTEFHFGRSGRHTDDHADRGGEEASAGVDHADESAHHLFASVEVGNDAIVERTNHANFFARLFVHQFGALAHSNGLFGVGVEGNDGGLVDHNLAIADDDGVGCAQVHGKLALHGEEGRENTHLEELMMLRGRRMCCPQAGVCLYFSEAANHSWIAVS